MNRAGVERWIAGYEELWRTPGTDRLRELFTDDDRCRAFEEWPFAPARSDGH